MKNGDNILENGDDNIDMQTKQGNLKTRFQKPELKTGISSSRNSHDVDCCILHCTLLSRTVMLFLSFCT